MRIYEEVKVRRDERVEAKRTHALKEENAKLKRIYADLALDKHSVEGSD